MVSFETTSRSGGEKHHARSWILLVLVFALVQLSLSSGARAQQFDIAIERFGSFFHFKETPNVLFLLDQIEPSDSFELRRAIRQNKIDLIVTSSPGGGVFEALQISGIVFDNKISTYVPKDGKCESACSFIFFAGQNRIISGNLGVHQFFTPDAPSAENVSAADSMFFSQFTTSEIIGFLNQYGTPPFVYERMFSTSGMYYFDEEALTKIARGVDSPTTAALIASAEEQLEVLRRNIAALDDEPNESEATSDGAEGEAEAPTPTDPVPGNGGLELAAREQADFDWAKVVLGQGDFRAAAYLFATFIQSYPGSPLTQEAHYLRGDAFAELGETSNAARAYLEAFSGSPDGPFAADSLLKIGEGLGALGQQPEACVTLSEVGARFPGSMAATQARFAAQSLKCD